MIVNDPSFVLVKRNWKMIRGERIGRREGREEGEFRLEFIHIYIYIGDSEIEHSNEQI